MSIVKTLNENPTEAEDLYNKTQEIINSKKEVQEEIRKGESNMQELLRQEIKYIFGDKNKAQIQQMIKFNQNFSKIVVNRIVTCIKDVNSSFIKMNESKNQEEWNRLYVLTYIWREYFQLPYDIDFFREFSNYYISSIILGDESFTFNQ